MFRNFCLLFFFKISNLFYTNKTKLVKNKSFDEFGQKKMQQVFFKNYLILFYVFFVYIVSLSYKNTTKVFNNFRINERFLQLNEAYFLWKKDKINSQHSLYYFFYGLYFFWVAIRFWVIALILGFLSFYYFLVIKLLPFNKVIFQWLMLAMFFYWLISGFVFFTKKYKYGKFTTAIQRFWRRSYILFWLIESSLFAVFIYLTFNANNEPVYMYDYIQIYKTHLFSWRYFLLKILPVTVLIFLGYFLLLTLKWSSYHKIQNTLAAMTLLIVYFTWLEFYQVFHITQFYGNLVWLYDSEEAFWNLEIEFRRTRIVNHYIMVCFFAKFFHIIFILIFWIFFILRVNEQNRAFYPLLSANLQNFVFLYVMTWIYMFPWFKFYIRRYMDYSYYWFFLHTHQIGFKLFFSDLKLFYFSLFSNFKIWIFYYLDFFKNVSFYYWNENSILFNNSQFIKHAIRDKIIMLVH